MIPPSNFVLRLLIEEYPNLVRNLNAHYRDAASNGGFARFERDVLLDVLGQHFVGRSWPRVGDIQVTKRFMTDLQKAMTAASWKVDWLAMA